MTTNHGWTSHGHPCCVSAWTANRPNSTARCGGPDMCKPCGNDRDAIHNTPETPNDGPSVPPRSFTSRVEELRTEAIEAAARALAADAGLDLDNLAKDADPGDTAADLAAWRSNWIESGTAAVDAVLGLPIVLRAAAEELAQQLEQDAATWHNNEGISAHEHKTFRAAARRVREIGGAA